MAIKQTQPNLATFLQPLTPQHRSALEWFIQNAGTIQRWPAPLQGNTLLASKAKGIYKPKWSDYALSVRESLGEYYSDRKPILRLDGTWRYDYHQEAGGEQARLSLYTNRGLDACFGDHIPIGVMRQATPKPKSTYYILGVVMNTGWKDGRYLLEGFSSKGELHPSAIDRLKGG